MSIETCVTPLISHISIECLPYNFRHSTSIVCDQEVPVAGKSGPVFSQPRVRSMENCSWVVKLKLQPQWANHLTIRSTDSIQNQRPSRRKRKPGKHLLPSTCRSWIGHLREPPIQANIILTSHWKRIGVSSQFHTPILILWNWFLKCHNSNFMGGIGGSTPTPIPRNTGDSKGFHMFEFPSFHPRVTSSPKKPIVTPGSRHN